jgi:membrane-bound acyltransferase YfiQ involved in biofilm formation
MLTPLLNYINRKPYGFISVLIFNMASLFVLYLLNLGDLWFVDDPYYLIHSPFLLWVIFYQMGLLIGSRDSEEFIPRNMHKFILPAILVALVISVVEVITILSKYDDWHTAICAIKYSSFIYSTCIIFGFLVLRERLRSWPRFLVVLGDYSFGIYLIHMIILRGIVRIMPKVNTIHHLQVLYELMIVLITLTMCYVLIAITRKILPKPFYGRVLGF